MTDVPTLARRGVAALRRDGPGYALALAVDLAFERALGIETREYVEVDDAGITGRNRAAHAASSWLPLAKALRAQGDVSGDVFLDYGAGKGRALALARNMGFARVVGLELSPLLAAEARANLKRQRRWRRRLADWELVEADAVTWRPPDDANVVYMFSPFTGPIFASAVENLLTSLDARPRPMRLIYNNPFEHNFLLRTGRFTPVSVTPANWPSLPGRLRSYIVTYEVHRENALPRLANPARVGKWAGEVDTSGLMPPGQHDSLTQAARPVRRS